MAESTDSFNLFAEATRDRSWSLPDESARELKRTSGVITPDAKELCTKKYNSFGPEDYSSDEDPAERRAKRKTAPPSTMSSISISRSLSEDAPVTDAIVDASQRINALSNAIVDTTTVTTHLSNASSVLTTHSTTTTTTTTANTAPAGDANVNIPKGMIAPVAISVYGSQRLSTSSLAITSNTTDNADTTTTELTKENTALFEHISQHDNHRPQHDDNDETASCTSSAPTEIVDYDEPDTVSSSSPSVSTLDRVRHVADTIAAALRPKLFPVFHIRDFAYPDNDPRHKGIYPRPVSAYRSVTNLFSFDDQDNPLTSNEPVDNSMLSFASSETSSSANNNNNATEDGRKDEYTGPAKAIHDFYAEDPKDVLFKAGEECWIDRQLSQGVLLTFKNGQRCHVRESYLEFTNHE